jgi:hypothetical protein
MKYKGRGAKFGGLTGIGATDLLFTSCDLLFDLRDEFGDNAAFGPAGSGRGVRRKKLSAREYKATRVR